MLLNIFFPGCEVGWRKYHSDCYRHFNTRLTWTEAKADCQKQNADLADILDIGTNDFIKTLSSRPGPQIWIGGSKQTNTTDWMWVILQPSPWNFENWSPGQPSGDGDCVTMFGAAPGYKQGYWNDAGCSSHYFQYVCKMQSVATETTQKQSAPTPRTFTGTGLIFFYIAILLNTRWLPYQEGF